MVLQVFWLVWPLTLNELRQQIRCQRKYNAASMQPYSEDTRHNTIHVKSVLMYIPCDVNFLKRAGHAAGFQNP